MFGTKFVEAYDRDADALYITFTDHTVARSQAVTDCLIVDLDAQGNPVGLEVLYPDHTRDEAVNWLVKHGFLGEHAATAAG